MPDRFAITHDAGITLTTQHGRSTQRVQLPIGQMYHVAVDNQVPYYVYSNMQDDGTMRGSAIAAENAGAGYNGSGNAVGSRPRRLRVGLHRSRSGRSEHRLVDLLRQQGDALRPPARRSRARSRRG